VCERGKERERKRETETEIEIEIQRERERERERQEKELAEKNSLILPHHVRMFSPWSLVPWILGLC
jgi:hypothetical protein